ncbi:MAG: hybrid sensor histidine kinase/response regulator [Leptolyngbyaceae cyanobacterium bins.349]|nr:hybrid sensor histidine kinase/response regulator [Leptolyngbyaceae cyanobacterium bins.349]
MSKELEIRRQFLDEAQEYLEALDTAVIGLSDGRVDIQRINSALRAAHSIKGGAGMMGFQWLSQFAHRLEDAFKVLKTQSQSLAIDAALENLLLKGINSLRTTIHFHQHDQPIHTSWVDQDVEPIFQALHDRLGDPHDEDAVSVLATESGQDILVLLFETEVEECLQRLEAVLADPAQPCLETELTVLAQELGGLGEMLQLNAFSQLCEVVEQTAAIPSNPPTTVAQAALKAWRRSQSLVLAGQLEALPTTLPKEFTTLILAPTHAAASAQGSPPATATPVELEPDEARSTYIQFPEAKSTYVQTVETPTDIDANSQPFVHPSINEISAPEVPAEIQSVEMKPILVASPQTEFTEAEFTEVTPLETPSSHSHSSDFQFKVEAETHTGSPDEDQHATVRVAIRQLNQLNDLFGELTIERNGFDLYLKRLRNLSRLLTQRLRSLEQFNMQLQNAYDRIIPHTLGLSLPLLPASFNDESLDALINYEFDSLEMDQYNELHLLVQQVTETIVQSQEVSTDIDLSLDDAEQTFRELNKTAKQLQTNLTQIRMRPLSDIADRYPRALREWCLEYGKQAALTVKGGNTLIERSILEALNDPLMHLLRNAFDHGIETPDTRAAQGKPPIGTIEITALHQGNRTIITLKDDGRGISLDKIRQKAQHMGLDPLLLAIASEADLLSLIFEPGFSTSDRVTDLSGRGVGLDVVRDSLRQIRGEIGVNTKAGEGTTFTLSVPFTLSVVRVLLVESNNMLLAIPTDVIQDTVRLEDQPLEGDNLNWQGQWIKRIRLSHWLNFNCPQQRITLESTPTVDAPSALIVSHGSHLTGIQVDLTWGEQEVTIRRAEGNLPMPEGFVGCAIVADGRVVPLVNVADLLDWIISCKQDSHRHSALVPIPQADLIPTVNPISPFNLPSFKTETPATVLIVDDSINIRRFLALTLERAGYRVEQAKDGLDALDKLQRGITVQAIICDIEMPRLDGFGFLTKLKPDPALGSIPVAMLTSRIGAKHRRLAFNLGASAYFSKPYNEQELLQTLEELIASPSLVYS